MIGFDSELLPNRHRYAIKKRNFTPLYVFPLKRHCMLGTSSSLYQTLNPIIIFTLSVVFSNYELRQRETTMANYLCKEEIQGNVIFCVIDMCRKITLGDGCDLWRRKCSHQSAIPINGCLRQIFHRYFLLTYPWPIRRSFPKISLLRTLLAVSQKVTI